MTHLKTLTKANLAKATALSAEIRVARVELRRDVKERTVSVPEILRSEMPDYLIRLPIEKLLLAVPRLRVEVRNRMLREVRVSPLQGAARLTVRQRQLLADLLEEWEAQQPRWVRSREQKRRRRELAAA